MSFISFYQLNDSLAFFFIISFLHSWNLNKESFISLFCNLIRKKWTTHFFPLLVNFTGWIIPGGLSVFVVLRHHASFCWSCFIAVFFFFLQQLYIIFLTWEWVIYRPVKQGNFCFLLPWHSRTNDLMRTLKNIQRFGWLREKDWFTYEH